MAMICLKLTESNQTKLDMDLPIQVLLAKTGNNVLFLFIFLLF